jgi:hypothetical protein
MKKGDCLGGGVSDSVAGRGNERILKDKVDGSAKRIHRRTAKSNLLNTV